MSKTDKERRQNNKERRLKDSTRDKELRVNRRQVKQAIKDGDYEMLEYLADINGVRSED